MTEPTKPPSDNKMDPGWNDPPTLNYSPSNPPPKSRITNKRIAFPLSGSPSGSPVASLPTPPKTGGEEQNLPPPPPK